ncbi:hypothetical protein KSX_89100 [Ktedonospora formicarum]|uniref:Transposase n=1 Tax=Ktedonospora formicarum TaxID=2778364 RepID=A0A8J3I5K9_9CHLR|nr:hypothetical protein KSX_89100 [Ktedonospora formicarum]
MLCELERMQCFLTKGLTQTAALWLDVKLGYAWIHRAAHILTNDDKQAATEVCQTYEDLLAEMKQVPTSSEALATMLSTFRKVTASYWPGLFHCYDIPDLPCTNNELEQYLGSARYHERRATGRKQASPGLVVRGAVRIVASVASRLRAFSGPELCPTDFTQWRTLRSELNYGHEARRMQYRFRQSPEKYLVTLEEKLIKKKNALDAY